MMKGIKFLFVAVLFFLFQNEVYTQYHRIDTFTVNGVSFEMIRVAGGSFEREYGFGEGETAKKGKQQVTLDDFSIGKYEVTQQLWKAVMGKNPSYFAHSGKHPVDFVSWNDVQRFLDSLNRLTGKNFRLPSEAEWEFAAKGGINQNRFRYSGSNTIDSVCWYWGNASQRSQKVGQKWPNHLGIYDMSGNVSEWCQDWFDEKEFQKAKSVKNPAGPSKGTKKVLRGGSWGVFAQYCRINIRRPEDPNYKTGDTGFRLVLSD